MSDRIKRNSRQQWDFSTPSGQLVSHIHSIKETVRNESKNTESVEIRKIQVSRRTLTNLSGVHVVVANKYAPNLYADINVLSKKQLHRAIRTHLETKLRCAGINVLSKEQLRRAKGKPILLASVFALQSPLDDSFSWGGELLELNEQVSLERNPDVTLRLVTWVYSGNGLESGLVELSSVVGAVVQEIDSLVEKFADDYKHINPVSPNKPSGPEIFTFTEAGAEHSDVVLKGLTELHVPQLYSSAISVKTTIIPQLEKAGITVLSSEQWNDDQDWPYPKTPYLYLKASVYGDDPECSGLVHPLQLIDRVTFERNPEIIRELPVWEYKLDKLNINLTDRRRAEEVLRKMTQDVQDMVDEFISAYLSANAKNYRILVINDNQRHIEDWKQLFEEGSHACIGFEIDAAHQGQEGLQKIRQAFQEGRPYVVAFVDVRMPPGWDGVRTIERIWVEYPDLPAIIHAPYSDYSAPEIIERLGRSEKLLIFKFPPDDDTIHRFAVSITKEWECKQAA